MNNKALLGYGFSLDYLTYYGIVVRLEYAFNNNRYNATKPQNGLFIHLNAAI